MVDPTKTEGSLELLPLPAIQQRIVVVRERHVMLDEDLAVLYGVQTGRLIQQVRRNIDRFPSDFMFQLTKSEAAALRSNLTTPAAQAPSRIQVARRRQVGSPTGFLTRPDAGQDAPRPPALGFQ